MENKLYLTNEDTINKAKTLDNFIKMIHRTTDGKTYGEFHGIENFKSNMTCYKRHLEETLPMFSFEEIIKIIKYWRDIRQIANWKNYYNLLRVLELESFIARKVESKGRTTGSQTNMESIFLINGKVGDVFYTHKLDRNMTSHALYYNRKIKTEAVTMVSGNKSPVAERLYKVTIIE